MEILNQVDLRHFVLGLIEQQEELYRGSLEEYLRALYSCTKTHRQKEPSYALFASLFQQSFQVSPAPFNEAWLGFTRPPNIGMQIEATSDYFSFLEETLLFQIADLARMTTTSSDPLSYFGTDSPTGNRWFNFDPFSYLECGTALLEYSLEIACTWADLAEILEHGRLYE